MATIARSKLAPEPDARSSSAETRFVLRDVPWPVYERLRELPENRHVRMTYFQGSLELMSPSQRHEEYVWRLALLLIEVVSVLGIKCKPLGSTTWKREGTVGKEADGCFYLASYEQVRGKTIDLRGDPPPDLAIEVEVSRAATDALSVYAALAVPELWRFDGETLRIAERQPDGTYANRDRSVNIPALRADEIARWIHRAGELDDDIAWKQEVREWAERELAPRGQPG
jgi:Uma2 family endonuclease